MPDTGPEDASESTASLERTPAGAAAPDRDTEAARLRFDLAIDAAGIGGFDYDLTTGRLTWDDRLIELFGYRPDEFEGTIEAFFARLHPDDVARKALGSEATGCWQRVSTTRMQRSKMTDPGSATACCTGRRTCKIR